MSEKTAPLELAQMIAGLRDELEKAQEQGQGKKIHFGVENIELELEMSIVKKIHTTMDAEGEISAKGLVKYVVGDVTGKLSFGAEGDYEKVSTQKIKLSLKAKNSDGTDTNLSGER